MAPIARLTTFAFDCRDPRASAEFYAALTGWEISRADDDWIELTGEAGLLLAFQLAPDHQPPTWPGSEHPQQAHLDFDVDDLDRAEDAALAIGARKAAVQPHPDYRVFLDPAGHPFCLCLAGAS
jgi:catechol 2,3-dioxygenase-like lactoylglutathione lyase family enzyme